MVAFTATAALDELDGRVQVRGIRPVLISAEVVLLVVIDDTVAYRDGQIVTASLEVVSDGEAMVGGEVSLVVAVFHGLLAEPSAIQTNPTALLAI